MNKYIKHVGADAPVRPTSKARQNKGITLIALVITIIVMLILVAVTINMAVNGGLFDYAGKAVSETQNAIDVEQQLADGRIQIGGVWYDSIDDYLAGEPSKAVKITLSIAGEKATTVPVPTGFTYKEGTINTGYVIQDEAGNEFVWVPVDKDQKITLKITSEKDVTEVKLYDPYGDEILTLADDEIETTYSNTSINPTINGIYTAMVTTEDGTEIKKLTVKSLYAIDAWNDWYTTDEYAISQGYSSKQERYQEWADQDGYASIEAMFQDWGYSSIEEYELAWSAGMKKYKDGTDYSESVNTNGGFYIARYEAGTTIARTSVDSAETDAVSQKGAYPYNYVTFDQAQVLAKSMYSSTEFTVDLITGSGWDRTLGWIYETGSKNIKEIAGGSTSWGNYYNAKFDITTGEYSENYGSSYTVVSEKYTKADDSEILLTSGAATRNCANNIFDLAGNVWEWTNEAYCSTNPVQRGGSCLSCNSLDDGGAYSRLSGADPERYGYFIGFRTALYIK